MFERLNLQPRPFAKMVKLPNGGGKVPAKERPLVQPTQFGKERAQEIANECSERAQYGPWTDQMEDVMTDGEMAFVHAVWDCCPGNYSFYSAFCLIWQGAVEAYQQAAAKLD